MLADLPGDDIILCQITSQQNDNNAIPLDISSFFIGSLPLRSYICPARIFTADKNLIIRKAGTVNGAV